MLEDTFTVRRYRHDSRSADQGELREILSAIRKMRLVVIFGEVGGASYSTIVQRIQLL